MTRRRILLAVLAAGMVLSLTAAVQADTTFSVSYYGRSVGVGVGFGDRMPAPRICPPVYRHADYGPPWRHRVIRMAPPVMMAPPVIREVVIAPAPVVMIPTPVVVQSSEITVWITNTNGSRTSVKLTRDGGWYVGPRGEYYAEMPTNEQLRVVYGF